MIRVAIAGSFAFKVCSEEPQLPRSPAEGIENHPSSKPKIYVESFRGPIGRTTTQLIQDSIKRSHVFDLSSAEGADTYTISATAVGGKIDAVIFKPGGGVLMKRIYESPNLRQNAHRLSDDITEIVAQQPGIASTTIGFVSDHTGFRQVYLCDFDGHDIRQITSDSAVEAFEPCLPISHGKIFFTGKKNGYHDIYSIDLTKGDSAPTRIINAPGNNRFPSLSPDGSRLAVAMSYSGTPDLYVTSAAGGQGRRLTDDPETESHSAWSPDGRSIAFTLSGKEAMPSQLAIIAALGGKKEIAQDLPGPPSEPEWSPDGRFIAFSASVGGEQAIALFDTTKKQARLLINTQFATSPTWAPDSRHLAFVCENALWIYELTTGARERIVSDFGNISETTWSQ